MIKFINWFIRPLGYVCVKQEHLDSYMEESFAYRQRNLRDLLSSQSVLESPFAVYTFHFSDEKPEDKDNVVPFNKLV